jgi:hypothetical protein
MEEPKPYRMRLATQTSVELEAEPQRKERSISSSTSIKSTQPNISKPTLSMSEDKPIRSYEAEVNPFSLKWGTLAEKKQVITEATDQTQSDLNYLHLTYDRNSSDIIRKYHVPRRTWRNSSSRYPLLAVQGGSTGLRNGPKGYVLKSKPQTKPATMNQFSSFRWSEDSSRGTIPFIRNQSHRLFYTNYQNADFSMSPGFIKPNASINLKELLLECKQGVNIETEGLDSSSGIFRQPKRRWFDSEPIPNGFLQSPAVVLAAGPNLFVETSNFQRDDLQLPRIATAESFRTPPQTPTLQIPSPRAMESPSVRKRRGFNNFASAVRKESIQLMECTDNILSLGHLSASNTEKLHKKFSQSSGGVSVLELTVPPAIKHFRQSSEFHGRTRGLSKTDLEVDVDRRDKPSGVAEKRTPTKSPLKTRKLSGEPAQIENNIESKIWDNSSDSEGSTDLELTMNRQFSVGAIGNNSSQYNSLLKDIGEVNRVMSSMSIFKGESEVNLGGIRNTLGGYKDLRSALELGGPPQIKRTQSIGGIRKINPFKSSDPLLNGEESSRKKFQVLEHKLKKGAILSLVIIISESTTLRIKIAPGRGAPFETYKVCQDHHQLGDESPTLPERKLSLNADSTSSMEQAIHCSQGKFRIISVKPLIFNKDPIRRKLFSYTLDYVQEMFWFDSLQNFLELVELIYNDLTNYYITLMKEINASPASSKIVESGLVSALEVSGKLKGYNLTIRAPLTVPTLEYPIILQQASAGLALKVRPGTTFKATHPDFMRCLPLGNLKALRLLLQD